MKKFNKLVGTSLVILSIFTIGFLGCEKETEISQEEIDFIGADLSFDEVLDVIMNEEYANQELYITKGREIDGVVYYNISNSTPDFSIIRIKFYGEPWSEWGKACNI